MTFIEAFDKIKASMKDAKADKKIGHLAIQVNINDPDASGICYIEVNNGKVFVEPYDYYDRDAIIHVSHKTLVDIMKGKLTFEKAVTENMLTVEGDYNSAVLLKTLVKKPAAKKPAAKKTPAKKAPAKAAEKKAEVKAEEKKAPAKTREKPAAKKETAKKAPTAKKPAAKPAEKKTAPAKATEAKAPAAAKATKK